VLLLALATICVPGVGYALALVALVTLTRVRPHEIEHRLLVRDLTLSSGGASSAYPRDLCGLNVLFGCFNATGQLISENEPNRHLSARRPYDARLGILH
jgi:hypothetical protein